MRLTVAAEYALRTVLHLSRSLDRPVRLSTLAQSENIPEATLRPLLRWLKAKELVRFEQGRAGGYRLARNPEQLSLREVLETVEGPLFVNHCLFHGSPCPMNREHWCPVHDVWVAATQAFLQALEGHNVGEMGRRVQRWNRVESVLEEALAPRAQQK